MKPSTALRLARKQSGMYKQGNQYVIWIFENNACGGSCEFVLSPRNYFLARSELSRMRQRRAEAILDGFELNY